MLQRIMLRKSNYRCVEWLEDRKVQEGILTNIKKVHPKKLQGQAATLLEIDDRLRERESKVLEMKKSSVSQASPHVSTE